MKIVQQKKHMVILFLLAFSVVAVLWITLFSRIGCNYRDIRLPFSSYKAFLNGSKEALVQAMSNVTLFVPIGIIASLILGLRIRQIALVGFVFSLIIEFCQWSFWLGIFECDDLLHNTLGAIVGALLVKKTNLKEIVQFESTDRKKIVAILIGLIILLAMIPLYYQGKKMQTMARYAAMNDREDGTRNLLILKPDPEYIGQNDFHVSYLSDGSVLIEGSSANRSWIDLGSARLPKGRYVFEGLSGVDKETVAIVLDHHDYELDRGKRITEEVGPIRSSEFELYSFDVVRLLISIYPGAEGRFTARPAIYRLD